MSLETRDIYASSLVTSSLCDLWQDTYLSVSQILHLYIEASPSDLRVVGRASAWDIPGSPKNSRQLQMGGTLDPHGV